MAVGPWYNWHHTLENPPLRWGVKPDPQGSNVHVYNQLELDDIVFFKSTQKKSKKFSKNGIFGVGKVIKKIFDDKNPYFYDEIKQNKVLYPYRFHLEPIKIVNSDQDIVPWIDGLPYTKGLNHIVEAGPLELLIKKTDKKWKTKLGHNLTKFPFEINEFYPKREIWRKLKVGVMGGIRPNVKENYVVVFLDAPTPNPKPGQSHNIYQDRYDQQTGLFYYTGAGQRGNQTLSGRNGWLVNSNKNKTPIYFFRQYNFGGKHQYVGPVLVKGIRKEIQLDDLGKNRKVYIFLLEPNPNAELSEHDAIKREIESEKKTDKPSKLTKKEIIQNLKRMNAKVAVRGVKTHKVVRNKEEFSRFKGTVRELQKLHYKKCQTCGINHFKTDKAVYSEVHHLIPWAKNHDDHIENLVVICATCHRKFHYAKKEEKTRMYQSLKPHYPGLNYLIPEYITSK